ncbi:MAG: asparaginase [Chloroflexota bacterium]
MFQSPYLPVFALTRGETVESIHNGAMAVVDARGQLLAWYGDPAAITYLRSSAKPFQALPFILHGGDRQFNLTQREISVMCASHSGTDEHVAVIRGIQAKTGVSEGQLLCGVHQPYHKQTADALRDRNEEPTPNRHNCSGKHTGMLAFVRLQAQLTGEPESDIPYIDPRHPIQQEILQTFAKFCDMPVERVGQGIDGCSAPNFAVPLRNAALGFARLSDPEVGGVKGNQMDACHTIVSAMVSHPDMVGGPDSFDTYLMRVAGGRILAKGGAEGYQGLGLLPGTLGPGSPGVGIALKIGDGDARGKARSAVVLEVLQQLGVLSLHELQELAEYGPSSPVLNWRKIVVGQAYPVFSLSKK